MGRKDLWQVDYFNDKERFADMINGTMFHGTTIMKFIPVITLILYLGKEEAWDGARTLYDLLKIDEELKTFVNNYKINLFDYHEEKDFSKFRTDNRFLFELLSLYII